MESGEEAGQAAELAEPGEAEGPQEPAESEKLARELVEEGPVTLDAEVDGISITVSADTGILPKDTALSVSPVSDEDSQTYMQMIKESTGISLGEFIAFDITLLDNEERQIQSNGQVEVKFSGIEFIRDAEEAMVYHLESREENEEGLSLFAKGMYMNKTKEDMTVNEMLTQSNNDEVNFSTDHFSIYGVGIKATATYEFYVGDDTNPVDIQIVLDGERLLEPVAPPKQDGKKFIGWYIEDETHPMNFDNPVEVDASPSKIYKVEARFENIRYVYFKYNNNVIATKEVASGGITNSNGIPLVVTEEGKALSHWSTTENGGAFDFNSVITGDTTLHAVLVDRWKVSFDTQGGSSQLPKYIVNGKSLGAVDIPLRAGYTFVRWNTKADGTGINYTNTTVINGDIKLYAIWKAETVKYSIIYWQENADDNLYTYKETVIAQGAASTEITLLSNQIATNRYPYFTYKEYDSGKIIKGDGTTVVNVYYSRNLYKVEFNLNRDNSKLTIAGQTYNHPTKYSFTAKYESDISNLWPTATHIPDGDTISEGQLVKVIPAGLQLSDFRGWYWYLGGVFVPFDFNMPIDRNDIVLYPVWNNLVYSVTYEANGAVGTVPQDNNQYFRGAAANVLASVGLTPPSGKIFIGWKKGASNQIYYPNDKLTITGNMILTAQWGNVVPDAMLTYKANGGLGADRVLSLRNNDIHVVQGNMFSQEGYEFMGWNTKADGSGDSFQPGAEIIVGNSAPTPNELYAKWQHKQYSVDYVSGLNGTINGLTPQTVSHGGSTTEVTAIPHLGYFFEGWDDGKLGPTRSETDVKANATYRASFAPRADITYTVNYLEQGTNKVLAVPKSGTGTFGTDVTETAIEIDGYNRVNPTSATITLGVSGNTINLYYTARVNVVYTVNYLEENTNDVLATVKTDIQYTVNYLEQGSNEVLAAAKTGTGTFGTEVTETAIEIVGYDKVDPTEVTLTLAVGGNIINFYYRAGNQILVYNANGGTGMMPDRIEPRDKEFSLDKNLFVRTGFKFLGWNKESNGNTVEYVDEALFKMPATGSTLYAMWTGLTVEKSANKETFSAVGEEITYTYKVTNTGNVTLGGPFNLVDNKIGVIDTSSVEALAPGATFTVTAKPIDPTDPIPPVEIDDDEVPLGGPTSPNNLIEIKDEEIPLASPIGNKLNMVDHFRYIMGYPDNTVQPEGFITREEVATVFFRLLTSGYRDSIQAKPHSFTDVKAGRWSEESINLLAYAKIIVGYADGSFGPGKNITRAELAAIASRFDNLGPFKGNKFSDINGHLYIREEDGKHEIWTELD